MTLFRGATFVSRVLWVLTAVGAAAALWMFLDNPDIRNTSRGATYTCLAPWDTVLNDASNFPGGEPPPDGDDIDARCRAAGEERFNRGAALATGSLSTGAVALVLHLGTLIRRRSATES